MLSAVRPYLLRIETLLRTYNIEVELDENKLTAKFNNQTFTICITFTPEAGSGSALFLFPDQLISSPEKIVAVIRSKLQLNTRVFARNCEYRKIAKETAIFFLETFHLHGATNAPYNRGLFINDELLAVASFSKGRNMDRLPAGKRSFELIRFCCKAGLSVSGGLSKLVKNFSDEKDAGDIMTYVDKQLGQGVSFASAGFKKVSDSEPLSFLINKKNFERIIWEDQQPFDVSLYYLVKNLGNTKMICTMTKN